MFGVHRTRCVEHGYHAPVVDRRTYSRKIGAYTYRSKNPVALLVVKVPPSFLSPF